MHVCDKELYPEYVKNNYNSIRKQPSQKQTNKQKNLGKILEQTFYKRRYMNNQLMHEKIKSLANLEIQIKATRPHLPLVWLKFKTPNVGEDMDKIKLL